MIVGRFFTSAADAYLRRSIGALGGGFAVEVDVVVPNATLQVLQTAMAGLGVTARLVQLGDGSGGGVQVGIVAKQPSAGAAFSWAGSSGSLLSTVNVIAGLRFTTLRMEGVWDATHSGWGLTMKAGGVTVGALTGVNAQNVAPGPNGPLVVSAGGLFAHHVPGELYEVDAIRVYDGSSNLVFSETFASDDLTTNAWQVAGNVALVPLEVPVGVSALSDKGAKLLGDLMPEMADEPAVQIVVDTLARELQRLEDRAYDILEKMFPQNADDSYGTLGIWESLLGLPVEPPGLDLATRQNAVRALVQARNASSGAEWVQLVTLVLGTSGWSHQEGPAPYTVTLKVPYQAGSGIVAGQLARVAQKFTPAHLLLASTYDQGFLIGVSQIGDAL